MLPWEFSPGETAKILHGDPLKYVDSETLLSCLAFVRGRRSFRRPRTPCRRAQTLASGTIYFMSDVRLLKQIRLHSSDGSTVPIHVDRGQTESRPRRRKECLFFLLNMALTGTK